MKKVTIILGVLFALMTATAYGQETAIRDEQGLRFQLNPAKFQVFVGVGQVLVDGEAKASTQLAGFATIHPLNEHAFIRPYLAAGVVDPGKSGVESFETAQTGVLVGYKVNRRFTILAGGSLTALFLDKGTEYRLTFNVATATALKKFDLGALQLLIPIGINRASNGDWNTVVVLGIGWVF